MQHINSFSGGMKHGVDYTMFPQDSYTWMLNGSLISKNEHGFIVTNSKGTKPVIGTFRDNEVPIGSCSFDNILYIITLFKEGGVDNVSLYSFKASSANGWIDETLGLVLNMRSNDVSKTPIGFKILASTFGYTTPKLIEVVAKESYDGSIDLYLCNGLNPNVIINTGIGKDGKPLDRFYPANPNKELFTQQSNITLVPTTSYKIENYGNMKPGTYYLYLRYEDKSLNRTPFIKEVGPIFIHAGTSNNSSGVINDGEARVSKRIVLNITDLDPNYKYISVGVVFYYGVNGIVSRDNYLIDQSYSTTTGSTNIILDGNNVTRTLVVEELLADNLKQNIAKTQVQMDGRLFAANWKGNSEYNAFLKEMASYIIPHAVIKDEDNFDKYTDENTTDFEYMEDEIYPLGVSFLIDGQYKTDVFPIYGWMEGQDHIINGNEQKELTYKRLTSTYAQEYQAAWDEQVVDYITPAVPQMVTANKITYDLQRDIDDNGHINLTLDFALIHTNLNLVGHLYFSNDPEVHIPWKATFPMGLNYATVTAIDGYPFVITPLQELVVVSGSESFFVDSFNIPFDAIRCDQYNNEDPNGTRFKNVENYFFYEYKNFPSTVPTYLGQDIITYKTINHPEIPAGTILSVMNDSDYKEVLEVVSNNDKGLFKFPSRKNVSASHFNKMGLKVEYKYANLFKSTYNGIIPNITGYYIVQGERKKNVITQGICTAAVETVGFNINHKAYYGVDYNYYVEQTSNLGTSSKSIAFPWFDGTNLRLFPVINIFRGFDGDDDYIWRLEEDSVTQLYVMNRYGDESEKYHFPEYTNDGTWTNSGALAKPDDLYNHHYINDYIHNVKTNKFCLFTPDIILDRSIKIPSTIFIKPKIKISNERSIIYVEGDDYSTPTQVGSRKNNSNVTYSFKDDLKRLLDPLKSKYSTIEDDYTIGVTSEMIQENQIQSNSGFSSRMKSILEVYGDDMQTGDGPLSSTLTKYLTTSRIKNLDAGILINRQYKNYIGNDNYSSVEMPLAGTPDTSTSSVNNKVYAYGSFKGNPYIDVSIVEDAKRALPVMATNLSMKTIPYIGIIMPSSKTYLEDDNFKGEYADFHNAIVNVCIYETIEDYIESITNSFNNLDERYSIVSYNAFSALNSKDIYRGDIISQKTFMRAIRWNDKPKSMVTPTRNWEYAWKQGKAVNIYLQSVVNTRLRVPTKDSTFYPFILSNTSDGVEENIDNFVWKSESMNMANESWLTNDGYNRLHGLMKLASFDDIMLNKINESKNRIRYSNKHISGAFNDAYKEILVDQYKDYGFEYGEIQKLIVISSELFSIQTGAINRHFSSTKLQSSGDSSEIILGDSSILADECKVLAEFGTKHPESVIGGDNGAYGVDWEREVIWRIRSSETKGGAVVYGCENLISSKFLFDIFKVLKKDYVGIELPQDLHGTISKGIISSYDGEKQQIYFTFKLGDKDYTLIFSERNDCFVGLISHDINYYMQLNNRLFSYKKGTNNLWEHNVGVEQNFHGLNKPFELEFIVNGKAEKDASTFNKEFQAHLINMCPEELESIEWTTEYQSSIKEPFINEEEFWTNPDYKENVWRIPIMPNDKGKEDKPIIEGPLGVVPFNTFESNSKMRGQWIKVRIIYKGKENVAKYIYLRSVITNFIISFT